MKTAEQRRFMASLYTQPQAMARRRKLTCCFQKAAVVHERNHCGQRGILADGHRRKACWGLVRALGGGERGALGGSAGKLGVKGWCP